MIIELEKKHLEALIDRLASTIESLEQTTHDIENENYSNPGTKFFYEVDVKSYEHEIKFLKSEILRISSL